MCTMISKVIHQDCNAIRLFLCKEGHKNHSHLPLYITQGEGWPLSQMERSEKPHDFSWNVKKMPLSEKWSWAIGLRSCPCRRGSHLWIRADSVWANSKIRASVQESTLAWEQTNICVVERELSALWGKQHTFVVLQSAVQTLYWLRWALHCTLPWVVWPLTLLQFRTVS